MEQIDNFLSREGRESQSRGVETEQEKKISTATIVCVEFQEYIHISSALDSFEFRTFLQSF